MASFSVFDAIFSLSLRPSLSGPHVLEGPGKPAGGPASSGEVDLQTAQNPGPLQKPIWQVSRGYVSLDVCVTTGDRPWGCSSVSVEPQQNELLMVLGLQSKVTVSAGRGSPVTSPLGLGILALPCVPQGHLLCGSAVGFPLLLRTHWIRARSDELM